MQQVSGRAIRGYSMVALAMLILVPLAARYLPTGPADALLGPPSEPPKGTVSHSVSSGSEAASPAPKTRQEHEYQPHMVMGSLMDTSSLHSALSHLRWPLGSSLGEIGENWKGVGARLAEELDKALPPPGKSDTHRLAILLSRASVYNFEGEPKKAYDLLAGDAVLGRRESAARGVWSLYAHLLSRRDGASSR